MMTNINRAVISTISTFVIVGGLGVGLLGVLLPATQVSATTSSSIKVNSSVNSQGSSKVKVKQSVKSNGSQVIVRTYREENGKVLEDSRRVISQGSDDFAIDRDALKQSIRDQANQEVEAEIEAAEEELETELEAIEQETQQSLEEAEAEIEAEKQQLKDELEEEFGPETDSAEAELQEQLDEELEQKELSFWQRLRAWIDERIAML